MKLLTIDFETYYDQQYSLSKMTTEEYLRDPRFEVIGFSIAVGDGKASWYSGDMEYLRGIVIQYDIPNSAVISYHSKFDEGILSWHFGINSKLILDPLGMARALYGERGGNSLAKVAERLNMGVKGSEVLKAMGMRRHMFSVEQLARYGEYCCNDTELAYRVFKRMLPHFSKEELKIMDLTVRMFTEPVFEVDVPLLEEHLVKIQTEKRALLEKANVTKKELMSNEKFAQLLRDNGIEPPTKISPTTGKEAYAFAKTDEGFKGLLDHEDPIIQVLAAARVGNKSTQEETRTERFIGIGKRGLIPVPLNYYAAHTGRWGGTDKINLQNLRSRGKDVNTIKRSMIAPDGYVVINSDASQIEARLLAWFAGQLDLVEDFAQGRDVYIKMATRIYNKLDSEIGNPSLERDVGKETVLGCGFGMGADRFAIQLKQKNISMPIEEVKRVIQVYREVNSNITNLWYRAQDALSAMIKGQTIKLGNGCISIDDKGMRLPSGLYIQYPGLRKVINPETGRREFIYNRGKSVVRIHGPKNVENLIQALANCLLKTQALLVARRYKWALTVHDSLVVIAPEKDKDEALEYVTKCMRYLPLWAEGLPVDCKASYAKRYGDCK